MKKSLVVLAAVAAGLLIPGRPGQALTTFGLNQDVEVQSNDWNSLLLYYYTTGTTINAGPRFGNRSVTFAVSQEEWMGAFLYNYSLGAFVEASYFRFDTL